MKKKVLFALAGLGMGLGLTTSAIAGISISSACSQACDNASYYCNGPGDDSYCATWFLECRRCTGGRDNL